MKLLFIGKNSKVFNILKKFLPANRDIDAISHKEINQVDFSQYDRVVVLSWSQEFDENKRIFNFCLNSSVIFVSSIAVNSLQLKDSVNYSSYPREKLKLEKLYLAAGKMVLRLGQISDINKSYYPVVTDAEMLVNFIFEASYSNSVKTLCKINMRTKSNFLSRTIYSFYLKMFTVLYLVLMKLLKSTNYGYTREAAKYFSPEIVIGNGLFASRYLDVNSKKDKLLISSNAKNITLKNNGFKNTLISYSDRGLGAFWHGVTIKENVKGAFKYVPWAPYRPKYKAHIKNGIKKINYCKETKIWSVTSISGELFYCHKLTIAAGWFTNCHLLLNLIDIDYLNLSDHELAKVGIISYLELLDKGFIKKFGPILYGKKVYLSNKYNEEEFLLDFRPSLDGDELFYQDSTANIIVKLIKQFNIKRFNQAFYNKFGFGILSKSFDVYIQTPARNSIILSKNNVKKTRLPKGYWNILLQQVHNIFDTFQDIEPIHSIDTQHVVGGKNLLEDKFISELLDLRLLVILGSPTSYELSAKHHTEELVSLQISD